MIDSLTGARFCAAIYVVSMHYGIGAISGHPLLRNFLSNGGISVIFFFVLSGFVLTLANADQPLDSRRFYVARFARIYPAYLLAFLLWTPIAIVRLPSLTLPAVATLTLTQAWFPSLAIAWNGPGWSLSCEAAFYLAFPLTLSITGRLQHKWLWTLLTALVLIACVAPAVYELFSRKDRILESLVFYHPVLHFPEFLLGVVLARIWRTDPLLSQSLLRHRYVMDAAVACGLASLGLAGPSPWWLPLRLCAIVLGILLLASGGSALNTFLSSRRMRTLGESSYAVYILQSPVMFLFTIAVFGAVKVRRELDVWLFLAYAACLTTTAIAVNRWIEKPARTAIMHVFGSAHPTKARSDKTEHREVVADAPTRPSTGTAQSVVAPGTFVASREP